MHYAPHSRSIGCQLEDIGGQEKSVPLAQGSPGNIIHGNNYQDDSLNSLTDEGFVLEFSTLEFSNSGSPIACSSSSPTTSLEILPNENYSLSQGPCIVQASDDFAPVFSLYQSRFPSLSAYPMNQQRSLSTLMMPWMQAPFIPHPYPLSVYNNHHQMQFQQNRIPLCSESFLGDYYVIPIPVQMPVMTTSDPFSLQTCNGAYLIRNISKRISGLISFNNKEIGFFHPLGQVCKTKRSLTCNFLLNSGKIFYVKLSPGCIKFSSNLRGVAYFIGEAGVRTCSESFKKLDPDVTWSLWKKSSEFGMNIAGRNQTHNGSREFATQQKKLVDPPTGTITYLAIPEGESVVINRKGLQFYSETRELSNITLSTNDTFFIGSTTLNEGSGGGFGHIYVRCSRHRFGMSILFDGMSLQVNFNTQSASLGMDGELSLSKQHPA